MKFLLHLFHITIVFILLSSQTPLEPSNTRIYSFSKAKKLLKGTIYSEKDLRKTFYCKCSFDNNLVISNEDCGYRSKTESKRGKKVEWEHIVPVSVFGKKFNEWKNGHPSCIDSKGKPFKGRNCSSKINKKFQLMQSDMYNLVPAVGELNAKRSDYSFGIISGEKRNYGKCDFEIEKRIAEPAENIRGNIARIFFYMEHAYPGFNIVNESNQKIFETWSKSDPVDKEECDLNEAIEKVQGNPNHIVKNLCKIFYIKMENPGK